MADAIGLAVTSIVRAVCASEWSTDDDACLAPHMLETFPTSLNSAIGSQPDAATVAALIRAIQAGAKQLGALGTRLAAVVRSGNAAMVTAVQHQFMTACILAGYLGSITSRYRLFEASSALGDCVALPLECGLALLTGPAVNDDESAPITAAMLESQARLLVALLSPGQADWPRVAQLAAPEPLLAWLSAAASTALAVRRLLHERGPPVMMYGASTLVNIMSVKGLFEPHYLALQRDTDLQHSLVEVLLPALHAAAVAMQLPPDRRPRDFNWRTLDQVVCALQDEALSSALTEHLASSSDGINPSAEHFCLVQSAAKLLQAAPASCPDELTSSTFPALWNNLPALLLASCEQMGCGTQLKELGAAIPDAQRQEVVRLLVQALTRLPTALRAAAEDRQQDEAGVAMAASALHIWRSLCSVLDQLQVQEPGLSADVQEPGLSANRRSAATDSVSGYHAIDSLVDVPAWCSAGTAVLRALPHAVTLASRAQRKRLAEGQTSPETLHPEALVFLMTSVAHSIDEAAAYCGSVTSGGPWSAADGAAAGEALWQLHTALCRCIHSVAAGSLQSVGMPVGMLSVVLDAAVRVSAATPAAGGRTATGAASHTNSNQRHLLAMSIAQAEAMLAAFQPSPHDIAVLKELLLAIELGPAALASSPPVQQALQQLAERLGEGSAAAAFLRVKVAALLHREPQPGDALDLARVAATRSYAYLRCANLAGEGGPAAGQGAGSQRCSRCRVAWYCGTACSHADWRAGHRRVCRVLGAARLAEQEREGV